MSSDTVDFTEVPWEEGARLVNECTYLYATEVRESEELTLLLTIVEAKAQASIAPTESNDPIAKLISSGKPIEPDETCHRFRLLFNRRHLISYTVLNESYGKYPEPPEAFQGKLFRVFSHSHLLELTKRTSYASDEYPGKLMHFEIACLNHVIDVICTAPPKIAVGKREPQPFVVN